MKVKLLVSRVGAGWAQSRGEIVEVSDSDAVSMIQAGQAEPVRAAPVERAAKPGRPEKAAR